MGYLTVVPGEVWALLGVVTSGLIAAIGHIIGRRSAREQTLVEASKVSVDQRRADDEGLRAAAAAWQEMAVTHGDRLSKLEGKVDVLQNERLLDQAWITALREHIIRGDPPPPPQRPTSL